MKIIFLDIDGVLNIHSRERDEYGSLFHKHLEDSLKLIVNNTDAKIVITSTWRFSGLKSMQEMWKLRNLPGEVIDITPEGSQQLESGLFTGVIRGEEIKEWLSHHPEVISYVIIDDNKDMLDEQLPYFVKTSGNYTHEDSIMGYGLTKKCAEKAIKILNNDKQL
jgi:hypothetical protein